MLLGLSLLIALGFEFVNGFHDTANAVATVIYTHSLPANLAVVYSGCLNLLGVVTSSGAVAFAIISLLPVELILQVGSNAGFAMIFALLIAAIIWNLGTWALGHSEQFLAHAGRLDHRRGPGQPDHEPGRHRHLGGGLEPGDRRVPRPAVQPAGRLRRLRPAAAGDEGGGAQAVALFGAGHQQAAAAARSAACSILTCGSVSFAHGSNDGQKGMGLIMLILIGAMPTAYALNRATPTPNVPAFVAAMEQTSDLLQRHGAIGNETPEAARRAVEDAAPHPRFLRPGGGCSASPTWPRDIAAQVGNYGAINKVPATAVQNVRNEMYIASEAVRLMPKERATATTRRRCSRTSSRSSTTAPATFRSG